MPTEKDTQKIIDEQMNRIPNEVKEAILSVDYDKKLQEITKNQKLLIDQAAKLAIETSLVLIGLVPITDYVANLEKNLELSSEKAESIAAEVNEKIFKNIRKHLEEMDEKMLIDDSMIPPDGVGGISSTNNRFLKKGEEAPRFTNSNEMALNRDQILNEIENPLATDKRVGAIDFTTPKVAPSKLPAAPSFPQFKTGVQPETKSTAVEIRPTQELEILPEEKVKDISIGVLEAKMSGITVVPQQIVTAKPETKLPEVKKRPSDGTDPYRESVI